MPKLYEYLGLIILFYSNEHEPIHVHAKCQGRENRAEFVIVDGEVVEIIYAPVRGKRPLTPAEMRNFEVLVETRTNEIIQKWIDYFVHHKEIRSETITRRIK